MGPASKYFFNHGYCNMRKHSDRSNGLVSTYTQNTHSHDGANPYFTTLVAPVATNVSRPMESNLSDDYEDWTEQIWHIMASGPASQIVTAYPAPAFLPPTPPASLPVSPAPPPPPPPTPTPSPTFAGENQIYRTPDGRYTYISQRGD